MGKWKIGRGMRWNLNEEEMRRKRMKRSRRAEQGRRKRWKGNKRMWEERKKTGKIKIKMGIPRVMRKGIKRRGRR